LTNLESEIKREHSDLIKLLDKSKPVCRKIFLIASGPNEVFRLGPKLDYNLVSVNLIVKFRDPNSIPDPEFKLRDLLADLYFELYGKPTKFSNSGTIMSSRLYERYLTQCLDMDDPEDPSGPEIYKSNQMWKINVFDFSNWENPLPLAYLDPKETIRVFPQREPNVLRFGKACEGSISNLYSNPHSMDFYLEVLLEPLTLDRYSSKAPIDIPPIKYLRPKNSEFYLIKTHKFTASVMNSGFSIGVVFTFAPIRDSNQLDPNYIPELLSVKITNQTESTEEIKSYTYDSDCIIRYETPVYKYAVLIFDPALRTQSHIKNILDGYLYDSKKILGIGFVSDEEPQINTDIFDFDEESLDQVITTEFELEFDQTFGLEPEFVCCENFIHLDVLDKN
jgi:hypothetical protein